jgi:ribosomal protein L37AE/L43A
MTKHFRGTCSVCHKYRVLRLDLCYGVCNKCLRENKEIREMLAGTIQLGTCPNCHEDTVLRLDLDKGDLICNKCLKERQRRYEKR